MMVFQRYFRNKMGNASVVLTKNDDGEMEGTNESAIYVYVHTFIEVEKKNPRTYVVTSVCNLFLALTKINFHGTL